VTTIGIGLALPTFTGAVAVPGEAGCLRAMAQRAEELRFTGLWVAEHLLRAPLIYRVSFLSPLSVLAHVAACTRHIRLGTAILVLPLRDPVLLAKELATLDLLTDGRLVLGIGTGWDVHEFESCGVPLRERGSRTDEALALLRRLLTEEHVTFTGRFHRVRDVSIDPRPARFPEVWIGGGSKMADPDAADLPAMAPSVLARICRDADVWIARPTDQALILSDIAQVQAACAGRERPLRMAHFNFVHVVDTDDREKALLVQRAEFERVMGTHRPFAALEACYLMGTPAEMVEKLSRLRRAGVTEFILGPLTTDVAQVELVDALVARPLAKAEA
jgi:probable F420-dependent oxidoreductase